MHKVEEGVEVGFSFAVGDYYSEVLVCATIVWYPTAVFDVGIERFREVLK